MTGMLVATTSRDRAGCDVMPPQQLLARSPAVLAARDRHRLVIEHNLQLAQAVQMSMVPQTLPPWSDYSFGACMEPAHAVGGDFFDVFPVDLDQLGFVVADVAGAGVAAALLMMRVATLLRVEARRGDTPAAVLHRLNQHLLEHNERGLFVTMVYGVLDRRSRVFSYARAGHEYPVVVTASGDVQLPAPGIGQPLGVLSGPLLDEQVIPLLPGATLLLYTDGITEAMDRRRRMFGLERMMLVAQAHAHQAPQAVCDALWHAVLSFRSPEVGRDDMTIVGVRAGANGSR
jgi:phosphoserine phosphatase RsbU/P